MTNQVYATSTSSRAAKVADCMMAVQVPPAGPFIKPVLDFHNLVGLWARRNLDVRQLLQHRTSCQARVLGSCADLSLWLRPGALNLNRLPDRITTKTDGFGLADAGQDGDVIKFVDGMFEPQPFDMSAGIDIDNQKAGSGACVLGAQPRLEGQSFESLVMPWPRQADHRKAPDKGQPTGMTGQKGDRGNRAVGGVNGAEFPQARVQHPQLAIIKPG